MQKNAEMHSAEDAKRKELVELHAHLGASINPAILWSIAHDQGIKLKTKSYWEFEHQIVLSLDRRTSLKKYLDDVYHPILDPLSSGTHAVERAVHETISGAYRSSYITIHELRFNPMKHNSGGKQDLDHIIMAALRGMERALLEYPEIQAGLIFCMDRQFSIEQNRIIAEKAIKYHRRGVVGIDFSNYNKNGFLLKDYVEIVNKCRMSGLKLTVHTGENDSDTDMLDAIVYLHPDRIGHGIKAAYSKKLIDLIVTNNIVLEICPMSNIVTHAVEGRKELKHILQTFLKQNIQFTINTDWPETIENGHLNDQIEFLLKNKILNEQDIKRCTAIAQSATFTKGGGINAYL